MQTSRRGFLTFSGAAAAAAWNSALAKPLGMPIGIQPYTVRNEMAKDVEGTLRQLAGMGYQSIEASVPFYGKEAAEARALFNSLELISPSGAFGNPKDDSEWARSIENATTVGAKYMIVSVPSEWHKSLDGWKRAAEYLNKLGAQSKKAGITVVYHNHHFEYKVYDGVKAYDQLLQSTDPALVQMEIDIFWTTYAGEDPLAYFEKYPGRFAIWHIKDLKKGFPPSTDKVEGNPFAEVGAGIIDWKRVFKRASQAGLKHYFVEQDRWDRAPLECAKASCDFLKKLKV